MLFCADFSRLSRILGCEDQSDTELEYMYMFLMSSIDAVPASQNILLAAESMVWGVCYTGVLSNNAQELIELFHLPPQVPGLFKITTGHPDSTVPALIKPRVDQNEVVHMET